MQSIPQEEGLVRAALAELGVRRLLLSIQDASFPSDRDEDVGRGSPGTRASGRLLALLRSIGFTGLQLGPQGQTSRDNPSPYDGTLFSRNVDSIALEHLASGDMAGLVGERSLRDAVAGSSPDGPARHRRAHDTLHRLLREAFDAFDARPSRALSAKLEAFVAENARWLERDALYAALSDERGGKSFRHWEALFDLWDPPRGQEHAFEACRAELAQRHARAVRSYAFRQLVAHDCHSAFREQARGLGLHLYGDLQIGLSDADVWSHRGVLLRDYVMGAPPSRTTPEGQPWNYAVIDPLLEVEETPGGPARGAALCLLEARIDKAFREYDGIRIDHPHGHVCPWVYRAGTADPKQAVQQGARLFESPDLPDHPALARYARVGPQQIDRSRARYADDWVAWITQTQIDRYASTLDAIAEAAIRHGHDVSSIACEVLSTLPRPLGAVLERLQLGRFRVTQKANLDDPTDVYRSQNAAIQDWIMLGNHDTPTVWAFMTALTPRERDRWIVYLCERLAIPENERDRVAKTPGWLAEAMLADVLASRAENVVVFFGDLFGFEERYNVPGTVDDRNWSLRLPPSFAELYQARRAAGRALDLPQALATALAARGPDNEHRASLARALRAHTAR